MMTQACTPGYSGGRDQVKCSSRTTWEKCLLDPISINGWTWCHVPVIPKYIGRHKKEYHLGIKPNALSTITNTKRAGGVLQVVECLPSNYEPFSSITRASNNKKVTQKFQMHIF
jgi:hypothetical protein